MQKEGGYESSDWLPTYKGKTFQVQPLVLDCFWRAQSGMLRWLSAKLLTRVRKWAFTTMRDLSLLGVLTFAVVLLKRVIIHMVMRIIIYTKDNTQSYSKIMSSLSLEVVQLELGGHLSTIWGEDSSTGLQVTEITCRCPFNAGFLSVWVTWPGCKDPNLPFGLNHSMLFPFWVSKCTYSQGSSVCLHHWIVMLIKKRNRAHSLSQRYHICFSLPQIFRQFI